MPRELRFSGGMANAIPPDLLDDTQSQVIKNCTIDEFGYLSAVRIVDVTRFLDLGNFIKAVNWVPWIIPSGCSVRNVVVAITTSNILQFYGIGDDGREVILYEHEEEVRSDKFMCASDINQFVFCDGRDGGKTHRAIIDHRGYVLCSPIGLATPETPPEISSIEYDRTADKEHTGVAHGGTLLYCYCYINSFGERSSPSPVKIFDLFQWLIKGENVLGEYEYNENNGGSIKSVTVSVPIIMNSDIKHVELYRSDVEYSEHIAPIPNMRLVASTAVGSYASNKIDLYDTNIGSSIEAERENSVAPAADDVAVLEGVVFSANPLGSNELLIQGKKTVEMQVTNPNGNTYINQFFDIALYDEAMGIVLETPHIQGLNWEQYSPAQMVFIDSDRTTPLIAMWYPRDSSLLIPVNGATWDASFQVMFRVKIPILEAYSTKSIYIVLDANHDPGTTLKIESDNVDGYASEIFNNCPSPPVRTPQQHVVYGYAPQMPQIRTSQQALMGRNKANWHHRMHDQHSSVMTMRPIIIDEYFLKQGIPLQMPPVSAHRTAKFSPVDGMLSSETGYMSCHWVRKPGENTLLQHIMTVSVEGIPFTIGTSTSTIKFDIAVTYSCAYSNLTFGVFAVRSRKVGGGWTIEEQTALFTLPGFSEIGMQDTQRGFLFLSWKRTDEASKGTLLVYCERPNGEVQLQSGSVVFQNYQNPTSGMMYLPEGFKYTAEFNLGETVPSFYGSMFDVNMGDCPETTAEILSISQMRPRFPVFPVGYRRSLKAYDAINYAINSNINFLEYDSARDTAPGKIQWRNRTHTKTAIVGDEILRIMAMRSFAPTAEANTIMAWTKSARYVVRAGDEGGEVIKLDNLGILSPRSIGRTSQGIIWISDGTTNRADVNDSVQIVILDEQTGNATIDQRITTTPQDGIEIFETPNKIETYIQSDGYYLVYNSAINAWVIRDHDGLDNLVSIFSVGDVANNADIRFLTEDKGSSQVLLLASQIASTYIQTKEVIGMRRFRLNGVGSIHPFVVARCKINSSSYDSGLVACPYGNINILPLMGKARNTTLLITQVQILQSIEVKS